MMGLSDGERISMIHSAILIQYTRVTDRRTNGRTDRQTELAWHICAIAYMLSRVKITEENVAYLKSLHRRTEHRCPASRI